MSVFFKKKIVIAWVMSCVCFLVLFVLKKSPPLQFLEFKSFDLRSQFSETAVTLSPNIVLVLIDEHSLQTMRPLVGRWPWPRALYAELLDFFSFSKAQQVIFDILFTETQNSSSSSQGLSPDDAIFVESSLVFGRTLHAFQLYHDKEDEWNKLMLNRSLPSEVVNKHVLSVKNYPYLSFANIAYLPFEELLRSASAIGFVNYIPDSDGTYRKAKLVERYHSFVFPSLSFAAALSILRPSKIAIQKNGIEFEFSDRQSLTSDHGQVQDPPLLRPDFLTIPLDKDGRFLFQPSLNFPAYSVSGILGTIQQLAKGETKNLMAPPEEFKNKIVFIGTSAVGTYDRLNLSIGQNVPGVYTHASVLSNILTRHFLKPIENNLLYAGILLACFMIAFLTLTSSSIWLQISYPVCGILGYTLLSFFLFKYQQLVLPFGIPILCVVFNTIGAMSFLSVTEGKERRRVRRLLAQYVSPAVLTEVMDKTESLLTPEIGVKAELTIFFSDIRDFTSFSEKRPPEQIVEMLNYYFHHMVDIVFKNQGTLDKFIGDAIMVFWGAPIQTSEHPKLGVLTALEMREKLIEINTFYERKGYPEIKIGMGIHTGVVILGNIGSEKKLDYTVIGDNVNVTSRLEGLTKYFGCDILISESTYSAVKEDILCHIVDQVQVKGKKQPIRVFYPLRASEASKDAKEARERADRYEAAFQYYQKGDWKKALEVYMELANHHPPHRVASIFLERCQLFLKSPPVHWEGIYTLKEK